MKDKAEILAFHGWAFDRHCWDTWKEVTPFGSELKCYDRGYFGESVNVEFSRNTATKIILAHSFGLHLCPDELLGRADLLVVLGGFLTFHPQAARFKRRSRLVLQQMIEQFQDNPREVVQDFWDNTFHPQSSPDIEPDGFNSAKLLNDLRSLNESTMDAESLKKAGKICILHGSRDGIVPKAKGREIYNKFHEKTTYFEIKDAGHALPFTHVEQCWNFLKPNIRQVINELN